MSAAVDALIETSLYASAVTLCILLFRALFHKAVSPRLCCLLWGVLLIRLMLPVTPESGFRFSDFIPALPEAVQAEAAAPGAATGEGGSMGVLQDGGPLPSAAANSAGSETEASAAAPRAPVDWRRIAFFVWLSGAAGSLFVTLAVRIRFYRRIKAAHVPESRTARLMLAGCAEAVRLRRPVRLYAVRMPLSPALVTLGGKTLLILPETLAGGKPALRYALLHELTHQKRGDSYVLLLLGLLRSVYWFNPFVYLAFSELRADMETACDAEVLSLIEPTEKRAYLMTLLSLFSAQPQPSLGFAQMRTKRLAKKRIKGAFMKSKSTFPARAAAFALVLALGLTCFTTACQSPRTATPGNAAASPGNAAASPGNATVSPGNAASMYTAVLDGNQITVTAPGESVLRYLVVDHGAWEHSETSAPSAGAVSVYEAARTFIERLLPAFSDQIAYQGGEIIAEFQKHEGVSLEIYSFEVRDAAATLTGSADAMSGEPLTLYHEINLPAEYGLEKADAMWTEYADADIEGEVMARAAELVQRFPNGDSLMSADSYVDGIQATFRTEDPICADAYLRMESGACYGMRIHYPSLTLEYVDCYPLGWIYCQSGTNFTEYLEPWALEALGLPVPKEDEKAISGPDAGVPTPTPMPIAPTPSVGAVQTQITDADYLLLAQSAEAAIGGVYSYADFDLPADASFSVLCRAWTLDVLSRLNLSVGVTQERSIDALDDPAVKSGMTIGFTRAGRAYYGICLGDYRVVTFAYSAEGPYTLRLVELAPLVKDGQISALSMVLYSSAA